MRAILYPVRGPTSWVKISVHSVNEWQDHPCVDAVMESAKLQPFIHDTCVSVMHRSPTGRLVWSRYRIFYKRHAHLPHNDDLNVKGDIVVMKIMRKRFSKQVNLASADLPVARFAVER